eukprot:3940339-Rhodomonas_salina.1
MEVVLEGRTGSIGEELQEGSDASVVKRTAASDGENEIAIETWLCVNQDQTDGVKSRDTHRDARNDARGPKTCDVLSARTRERCRIKIR